ncbi:unnamed protein product [Callosobruchus maculatus]|uniref:Uncharacterized protein n=1 Tax=Callosobruchus maculatus TaxID=64391 RepID=A0A653CRI6_CALMS|nr:unnamed protein product [Callosobruchus maculatus]
MFPTILWSQRCNIL